MIVYTFLTGSFLGFVIFAYFLCKYTSLLVSMDVLVLINTSIFACQGKKVSALFLGNLPRMGVHVLFINAMSFRFLKDAE
jgi:hypothetical protein